MNRQTTHLSTTMQFRTFEDLQAYQAARLFRQKMYGITRRLPDLEKFGLSEQIRRAAVSLTNNIAEGHGRYHYLDQIRFALQARGSLQELIDDLNVCSDEKYLPSDEVAALKSDAWKVSQLLGGYIRYLRARKAAEPGVLRDAPNTSEDDNLDELLNNFEP